MTPDPFDDLDEQLRTAVNARRSRRRGSRRALVAVAAGLVLTGGVAAGATLLNPDADRAAAQRAVDHGTSAAGRLPVCAMRRNHAAPRKIPGPPNAAVLSQLGVFRRPATAADRPPSGFARSPLLGPVLLKDTVRVAHADDGTRVVLFITRGTGNLGPTDPVGCALAAQAAARKAAASESDAVRARVEAMMSKRLERVRDIVSGVTDQLNFMQFAANGRTMAGGGTYITRGKIPASTSYSVGSRNGRRTVNIFGLVPDGITTVRAIDRGGPADRRVAPVTVTVHDNIYSLIASRRMGPRITLAWRNAAGDVVRRVHVRY